MLSSTSSNRRLLIWCCAAVVLAGCAHNPDNAPDSDAPPTSAAQAPPSAIISAVVPAEPAQSGIPAPAPPDVGQLTASFENVVAALPAGDVGVAIFDGQNNTHYGTWNVGAAWSTIKVPLAIAALRLDPASTQTSMQQAIAQSDNAAADYLWSTLGDPNTAAAAVDAVLRDGGDLTTRVQSQQVHPPYSPYGQTDWSTDQAAIFAFQLPCLTGAAPVLEQMRNLGGNQQWGLTRFGDVAAKGGWGPEYDGGYLVRQIAFVTNSSGGFGVSLAAKPSDGSFETGKIMLDQIGTWIDLQRNLITGGHC